MRAVWKYRLTYAPVFTLEIPVGAEVLHVALQDEIPCLWVLVDPDAEKTLRTIRLVGTGLRVVPETAVHLGTVLLHGEVWHFFEEWTE